MLISAQCLTELLTKPVGSKAKNIFSTEKILLAPFFTALITTKKEDDWLLQTT